MGYPGSAGEPLKQGIDRFYGYNCQSEAHNYYPDHLWDNDRRIEFPGNLTSDSMYSGDKIHAAAMDFLQQNKRKPFFLFLPYTLPHGDPGCAARQRIPALCKVVQRTALPAPADPIKGRFEPYPHAAFAAMVSRLDRYVGEVYRYVQQNGLADNTLIIFTSDNGPHREDGGDPDFFNGSGGFRGIKRDMYEGGIRVPFIANWKGTIKAGLTNVSPLPGGTCSPPFSNWPISWYGKYRRHIHCAHADRPTATIP